MREGLVCNRAFLPEVCALYECASPVAQSGLPAATRRLSEDACCVDGPVCMDPLTWGEELQAGSAWRPWFDKVLDGAECEVYGDGGDYCGDGADGASCCRAMCSDCSPAERPVSIV